MPGVVEDGAVSVGIRGAGGGGGKGDEEDDDGEGVGGAFVVGIGMEAFFFK
jgi:hypothetical protein